MVPPGLDRYLFAILLFLPILTSCNGENEEYPSTHEITINGRLSLQPLYRADLPDDWTEGKTTKNISDTREPIASWDKGGIHIVLHNFSPETKITPAQQTSRWKSQWKNGAIEEVQVAHGGFGGLKFIAFNNDAGVIAYAFSLYNGHVQKLNSKGLKEESADWTLKATGSKEDLIAIENELDRFVNSLELIQPIP